MNCKRWASLLALTCLCLSSSAFATLTYMGTSTGDLVIHYNDNGQGEIPSNQSYITSEFSASNGHGALFNFDPNLAFPIPGYGPFHFFQATQDQFGFDLNFVAPTWDHTSSDGSPLNFYDNVDGSAADRMIGGTGSFAFDDYHATSGAAGPGNPNSFVANSLFRGDDVSYTISNLTQVGTVFSFDINGTLGTDGLIHWYNPAIGSTPMDIGLFFDWTPDISFTGHFSYDSANDTSTNLVDRYTGSVDYFFNTPSPAVPEPATLSMIGLGLSSLGVMARRRRLA